MTETASFGGTVVEEPPADLSTPDVSGGDGGNRRKLLLVGGIVAVLILAAAAYFLFLKGGSTPVAAGPVPHANVPASTGKSHSGSTKSAAGKGAVTLPRVSKHPVGHDPFSPVVVPPASTGTVSGAGNSGTGNASANQGGGGTSTGTSTGTGTGTTTGTGNGQSTSPTQPTKTHKPAPMAATFLEFDHATAKTATFTLFFSNGAGRNRSETVKVKAPKAGTLQNCNVQQTFCGTRFLKHYGLLSINGNTVSIQIGDAGYQLKAGQKISATG